MLLLINEKLYKDPTQVLPEEPPYSCKSNNHITCNDCH
jgi:hypothetical protein